MCIAAAKGLHSVAPWIPWEEVRGSDAIRTWHCAALLRVYPPSMTSRPNLPSLASKVSIPDSSWRQIKYPA